MLKVKRLIGAAILSALPLIGHALGLGDLTLNSGLNQPLNAEIKVLSMKGTSKDSVKFAIASQASFDSVGISRPFFLSKIRFQWVTKRGRSYVRLTTEQPVKEPFLNFLIEVNWPNGRIVREYTVLLNPPMYSMNAPSVVVSPREVYTEINEIKRDKPKATATKKRKAKKKTTSRPSVVLPAPSFPKQSTKKTSNYSVTSKKTSGVYGPIKRGDTLWSIALKVRPSSKVSPQQMIKALYDANPGVFIAGDVHQVKIGSTLKVPTMSEINSARTAEGEKLISTKKSEEPVSEWKSPEKEKSSKPKQRQQAPKPTPIKKAAPKPQPVKEALPKLESKKAATPTSEPMKKATPKSEPMKKATPKSEPVKEAAPKLEPMKEATPKSEPMKEAAPPSEPMKEAAPQAEPMKEAAPKSEPMKKVVSEQQNQSQKVNQLEKTKQKPAELEKKATTDPLSSEAGQQEKKPESATSQSGGDRLRVITPTEDSVGKATTNVTKSVEGQEEVVTLKDLKDKLLLTNETLDATRRQNELLAKQLALLKEELTQLKKQIVLKDSILDKTNQELVEANRTIAELKGKKAAPETSGQVAPIKAKENKTLPAPFEAETKLAKVTTIKKPAVQKQPDETIVELLLKDKRILGAAIGVVLVLLAMVWLIIRRLRNDNALFDEEFSDDDVSFATVNEELYDEKQTDTDDPLTSVKEREINHCPGYELNELSEEEQKLHGVHFYNNENVNPDASEDQEADVETAEAEAESDSEDDSEPSVEETSRYEYGTEASSPLTDSTEAAEPTDADPIQLAEQFIAEGLYEDAEAVLIESVLTNPTDLRLIATLCKLYVLRTQQDQFDKTMLLVPHAQRDPLDPYWSEIINMRESTWPGSEWPGSTPSAHTTVDELDHSPQEPQPVTEHQELPESEHLPLPEEIEIPPVAEEVPETPAVEEFDAVEEVDESSYVVEWPSTGAEEPQAETSFDEPPLESPEVEVVDDSNLAEREAETKLSLAKAYIEMNDKEGAMDILMEVVTSGTPEQQSQAEAMMQDLKG